MAGWYSDAFSSKISRVVPQTTNNASTIGALGDAFIGIGDIISKSNKEQRENKLLDMKIEKQEQLNQDDKLTANTSKFDTKDAFNADILSQQNKNNEEYTKEKAEYDDRFWTKPFVDEPKQKEISLSSTAQKKVDDFYQTKFNDDAVSIALDEKYKTYDDFKNDPENAELVKYTDGKTLRGIKKQFDTTATQMNNLKTQKAINNLNAKLTKAEIKALQKGNDKSFQYTENTGTKIKSLVATSLGMDTDNFELDENKKQEFGDMVTQISTISKEYNLEPNLAFKLWNENKLKEKPKKEDTSTSWKDYQ